MNFSSDFLDFSGTQQRSFAIVFDHVTPGLALASNGLMNSFTSTLTSATFFVTPGATVVPEPTSFVLAGLGLGCLGLVACRRR